MAQTYLSPMLRVSLLMQINGQSPIPGVAANLTAATKHQFFVRPAVVPAPGTDPASILVVTRSGANVALSTAINDYVFNFVRPRYRLGAAGTNGDINFGTATIDFLDEGSQVATFISAYTIVTNAWVQTVGINRISSQLIVTLRAQSGRIVKLVYNHGISQLRQTVRPPTTDSGVQGFFNDIVGPNSIVRSRDGTPVIAAVGWFQGDNEKLQRDIIR